MKRAFTLIEMMLVLAIISILIGTMKVHVQHKSIQAEAKNIVECVKIYEAALTMYYLRNGGSFPENTNDEKIENVDALKPYYPKGFNTDGSIHSKNCLSIRIYDYMSRYGVEVRINHGNDPLRNEIAAQLKEFACESQIQTGGGTIGLVVRFLLKKGDDIYI